VATADGLSCDTLFVRMTSSLASEERPTLPAPGEAAGDPFVANTPGAPHHRFSSFDHELFASGPGSSPTQAKRALEAHLAETDRRLDEAGKLGTALVSQRKALAERLQEVEKLQKEGELGPDLRKKLVEIEREFNDLARESARVFLPKQRIPSNEANPGSPFVPEARSGRVSFALFGSLATPGLANVSPTALCQPFQVREPRDWLADEAQCPEPQAQKSTLEPRTRYRVCRRD